MDDKHSFTSSHYIDTINSITVPQTQQTADVSNNTTKSITVKRKANGRRYRMIMDGDLAHLSVKKIKRYLQKTTKVSPEEQRLFFNDIEVMCDDATGADIGLYSGAEMIMDEMLHGDAILPNVHILTSQTSSFDSPSMVKVCAFTEDRHSHRGVGEDSTGNRPSVSEQIEESGGCVGHSRVYDNANQEEQMSIGVKKDRNGYMNEKRDYTEGDEFKSRYTTKKKFQREIQELDDKWADLDRQRNNMIRDTSPRHISLDHVKHDQTLAVGNDIYVKEKQQQSHQTNAELQQRLQITFDIESAKQKEELRIAKDTIEKLEKKLSLSLKDKKTVTEQLWEAEDTIRAMKREQLKDVTSLRKQMTEELKEKEEKIRVIADKRISAFLDEVELLLTTNKHVDYEVGEISTSQPMLKSMLSSIYERIIKQREREAKLIQEVREKREEAERSANNAKTAHSRALQFEAEALKLKRQLQTTQRHIDREYCSKGLSSGSTAVPVQTHITKGNALVPAMLKHFADELRLSNPLHLDENDTCVVTLENDGVPFGECQRLRSSHQPLSLLITHDRTTEKLFLYSTLVNRSLPSSVVGNGARDADYISRLELLVSLYEALLEGALLGKEMSGGAVGLHQGNRLVLMSMTLDLNHCDEFALAASVGAFVEAVRMWTVVVADILGSDDRIRRDAVHVDTIGSQNKLVDDQKRDTQSTRGGDVIYGGNLQTITPITFSAYKSTNITRGIEGIINGRVDNGDPIDNVTSNSTNLNGTSRYSDCIQNQENSPLPKNPTRKRANKLVCEYN